MLRRRNLLMFLATAGDDVLMNILCEILLSSSANIKTVATLDKLGLSAETKADIIAFLKTKIPLYLGVDIGIVSLSDVGLDARPTVDMSVSDKDLIHLESIVELIIKRVSDIFINEKIISIVDAMLNADLAVNMDNTTKIETIIKDKFNVGPSVNVGNIINVAAMAIIRDKFNVGSASEILSETNARATINEHFNVAVARKILADRNIDLSSDINLYTSDIMHMIGKNDSIGESHLGMWAGKPTYMTTITDVVSDGLISSLNRANPIHMASNEKCITLGNIRPIIKTPLRFTASGSANMNSSGVIDSKSTSHISANIIVKSVSNVDMSMKKDMWEYPVWLTDTNLKITQAKIITRNNNSLEVE